MSDTSTPHILYINVFQTRQHVFGRCKTKLCLCLVRSK